jgi:hypothetical protein
LRAPEEELSKEPERAKDAAAKLNTVREKLAKFTQDQGKKFAAYAAAAAVRCIRNAARAPRGLRRGSGGPVWVIRAGEVGGRCPTPWVSSRASKLKRIEIPKVS